VLEWSQTIIPALLVSQVEHGGMQERIVDVLKIYSGPGLRKIQEIGKLDFGITLGRKGGLGAEKTIHLGQREHNKENPGTNPGAAIGTHHYSSFSSGKHDACEIHS
jgi:hypothetical protein